MESDPGRSGAAPVRNTYSLEMFSPTVVTQLARVMLLVAPADHEVSVTAPEVVDAAARDPAAVREFAQRALTVVAPGLAARDGQQHRAGHHLRVDARAPAGTMG